MVEIIACSWPIFRIKDQESTKYISGLVDIRYIPPREGGVSSMAKDKKSQDKKQEKAQDKAKKN